MNDNPALLIRIEDTTADFGHRVTIRCHTYELVVDVLDEDEVWSLLAELAWLGRRLGSAAAFRELADMRHPPQQKKKPLTNGSSGGKEKSRHARGVSAPTATTR